MNKLSKLFSCQVKLPFIGEKPLWNHIQNDSSPLYAEEEAEDLKDELSGQIRNADKWNVNDKLHYQLILYLY